MRNTIFVIVEKAEDFIRSGPDPYIYWTNAGETLASIVKIGLGLGAGFIIGQVIRGIFKGLLLGFGII